MSVFLGIDIGTSGTKTLAINAGGLGNPWIESLRRETNGQWTLTLQSQRGSQCEVLSSADLKEWTPLTNIINPGGRILWTDPATNQTGRSYRVRQLP